jgi:hypothetical protein
MTTTDQEIIAIAVLMRKAQCEYFKTRTTDALLKAKKLEAEFDMEIRIRSNTQGALLAHQPSKTA